MKDETYAFVQEVKEKGHTARSARSKRTHNGKGGRMRLPSDYMTKKEIESMNGEVKSYRLNEPMNWKEFKAMPDDIKVVYIKMIREKWNTPDAEIARMLGISAACFCNEISRLNAKGEPRGKGTPWDKEGFQKWMYGVPAEVPAEEVLEKAETEAMCIKKAVIPCNGSLVFECAADEALVVLARMLGDTKVQLRVGWDVI